MPGSFRAGSELPGSLGGFWESFSGFSGPMPNCPPPKRDGGLSPKQERGLKIATSEPAAHLSHFIPREKALGKD